MREIIKEFVEEERLKVAEEQHQAAKDYEVQKALEDKERKEKVRRCIWHMYVVGAPTVTHAFTLVHTGRSPPRDPERTQFQGHSGHGPQISGSEGSAEQGKTHLPKRVRQRELQHVLCGPAYRRSYVREAAEFGRL